MRWSFNVKSNGYQTSLVRALTKNISCTQKSRKFSNIKKEEKENTFNLTPNYIHSSHKNRVK